MTESTNLNLVGEQQLRLLIDQLSDQLCHAVDGKFDFAIKIEAQDETIEKLQMLINFVLDSAHRRVKDIQARTDALDAKTEALSSA